MRLEIMSVNSVRLAGGGRKQDSPVWEYFLYISVANMSECLCKNSVTGDHCNKSIKGKNPTNLRTHLASHHKEIYSAVVEKEKQKHNGLNG